MNQEPSLAGLYRCPVSSLFASSFSPPPISSYLLPPSVSLPLLSLPPSLSLYVSPSPSSTIYTSCHLPFVLYPSFFSLSPILLHFLPITLSIIPSLPSFITPRLTPHLSLSFSSPFPSSYPFLSLHLPHLFSFLLRLFTPLIFSLFSSPTSPPFILPSLCPSSFYLLLFSHFFLCSHFTLNPCCQYIKCSYK